MTGTPVLWDGSRFYLASSSVAIYEEELTSHGRLAEARAGTTEADIWGGPSAEESLQHFTFRFANSAVRIVFLSIDPNNVLGEIPHELVQSLSSDRVSILDVPCGAGANVLSLLAVVAFLRESRQLPALPLHVDIVGADISPTAMTLYSSMMSRLEPYLRAANITCTLATVVWDATKPAQTSALCDRWLTGAAANEYIVFVSALSGVGKTLYDSMQRSFEHISERISNRPSTLLWVEPGIRSAEKFVAKKVSALLNYLASLVGMTPKDPTESAVGHKFRWWHPIETQELDGSVLVKSHSRLRPDT